MADVTISYKGSTIATMDASGSKTLNTQGKYCEGDIGVVYAKPTSPTGTINIISNGTYNVTDKATARVTVPNTYAASDEGKVVSNGALVAQTSDTVTQNGTYDTTLYNEIVVNVEETMKAWTQLATVDCSSNSGHIELTNLDNLTEFYVESSGVVNGSSTASGYGLDINGTNVAFQFVPIAKTGTTQYSAQRCKWNGLIWEFYQQGGATSSTSVRPAALQGNYTYPHNVGAAATFKLTAPLSAYQATSGTITIWGR